MFSKLTAGLLILTLSSCNIFDLISLPSEFEEEEAQSVVKTNQHNDIA